MLDSVRVEYSEPLTAWIFPRQGTHGLYAVHGVRSPRWTSGTPQMLLVLIREFESRRGEILNLFARIRKKGSTAESA